MEFANLFQKGNLGPLQLKNRIVMLPMGTVLCGEWGEVTDDVINWYARRAKGGTGLIIVEVCMAATAIDPLRLIPRILRSDDDCFIPGLACLADAVHDQGAKIGIQLTAGGGAQASGGPWMPGLQGVQTIQPVSPSGIPAYGTAQHGTIRQPRALTIEEIEKCVELYAESARRVKRAGFDMIDIHAHEGYLIAQFLSPYFNKRTDKYGGSLDNRCRFLMEIVAAVRKKTGPDMALGVKYSIDEFIEGGRDIKESQVIAGKLEDAGVDAISCSLGVYGSKVPPVPPHYVPRGSLVYLTEAIKEVVKIPVMAIGRLDDPQLAERLLQDGKADFIGIGRGLIADPDWPIKVAQGKMEEIRQCLSCNECRIAIHTPHPIRCTVNPVAGREGKYDLLPPSSIQKKVVIVGGGPAGMEAARIAALRGHKVVLFEMDHELGGMLKLAAVPPHKEILLSIPRYYTHVLKSLGVELRLGQAETAEAVMKENPDAMILAIGGETLFPNISGIDRKCVVSALDVLSGKKKTGSEVVIAGGGFVGCEVANFLAAKNIRVTIVDMLDALGHDMDSWVWVSLSAELAEKGVKIITSVMIDEITDEGLIVIDKGGNKIVYKADTVVLALGFKARGNLAQSLGGKLTAVYTIGDGKEPRRIMDAVWEGFATSASL